MHINELFPHTFQALRRELGTDRTADRRPLWQRRLSADSDFCRAMVGSGYLTAAQMERAARRYRLGRSRDGGVIFWQIDQLGTVYDGKIMHYRPDGHRDHRRPPYWVSACLRSNGLLPADWTSPHCLFGTHLLKMRNGENEKMRNGGNEEMRNGEDDGEDQASEKMRNGENEKMRDGGNGKMRDGENGKMRDGGNGKMSTSQPVCVVEAEKTAVVMSELRPDYLWLATGGLYELTATKLFPLRGRRIILLPDTDTDGKAYATWYRVTMEAQRLLGHPIHLSPLLEQRATREQREAKIDIVDWVVGGG